MAKKIALVDASNEELLAELTKRLGAAAGGESTEFPSAEKIEEMSSDELDELCTTIGIEVDDLDDDAKKALLTTIHHVGADAEDIDPKDIKTLMTALGLTYVKGEAEANMTAIKDYLNAEDDDADAEESDDDADEEASEEEADEESADEEDTDEEASEDEDEEEEAPAKKKKSKSKADDDDEDAEEEEAASDDEDEDEEESDEEASDEDAEEAPEEVDTAAVVKSKGKYPKDEKVMQKRLDAFNKIAGDAKINVKKLGVKKAYAALLELLVDHEGNIADWEAPYIRENAGWCCGVPMKDVKLKGDKTEYGRCLLTQKLYSLDDENNFVEKD